MPTNPDLPPATGPAILTRGQQGGINNSGTIRAGGDIVGGHKTVGHPPMPPDPHRTTKDKSMASTPPYRFLAICAFAAILVVSMIVFLFQPVGQGDADASQHKIAHAVEQAGIVCLSDLDETKTKGVKEGLSLALEHVGVTGTFTQQQVRKSVELTLKDDLLLKERDRVRDCMTQQVGVFLAAQGIALPSDPKTK